MYFVVETKGTIEYLENRPNECNKIRCGRKHFKALGTNVIFKPVKDYDNFKKRIVNS